VLSDLYGEGRLIAETRFRRPPLPQHRISALGLRHQTAGGRYLKYVCRGCRPRAGWRWWVLGDRTQRRRAQATRLENRLVLSRAFTTLYKSMNVERVAPFFEAFRQCVARQRRRDEPVASGC